MKFMLTHSTSNFIKSKYLLHPPLPVVSRVAESLLSLALLDSPLSSLNSFLEAAGDPRLDSRVLLSTAHTAHYSAPGARQRRVLEVVSSAPALGLLPQILLSLGCPHPHLLTITTLYLCHTITG